MKTLVIIPTYNEKENIEGFIKKILEAVSDVDILVVDDNSPDGTADLVHEIAEKVDNLKLIVRKNKRGRGLAGIVGFKYAVENKFDYVIEMDADFSHNPKYIPVFLKEIENHDLVIGSRIIEAEALDARNFIRRAGTRLAHIYIRLILNINLKDTTSGFRCFRREVLEGIGWGELISCGPSIVEELLYIVYKKGYRIKEIPIIFEERHQGKSKLNFKKIISALVSILKIRNRYA